MAGGNDERVNLLISAAVDGLKNVEGLIGDLQELEQSGRVELPDNSAALREGLGKTSEEMQGLASRLTELREQQGLVTQFAELKRETKELGEQQQAAKARATELGKALSETENPTRAQTQEFERAKKAASDVGQAWVSNNQELNELRGSLEGAGISTKDLAGEQVRINKEIEGVNQQASTMSDELREVKDSADDVSTGTDKAAKSTKDLGEEAEQSSGLLGKLGGGLKTVAKLTAGVVAGVGASVATLTVFSKKQASVADELTNTSNAIGVNREALQVWQIAAERVGVSGDSLEKTLTSVTERLGKLSATGSGRAGQVFDALNMDIKEFQQLAPDQQLIKLAGAIEKLPKSEQVAVLRTLGSDAEKLMPLLEDNAAGLRAIAEEAEQAGAIYSEEELDKLNKANDVYNEINTKIQGLTRRIGAELAPAVGNATRRVMELFDQSEAGDKLIGMFKDLISWGEDLAANLLSNTDSIAEGFGTLWSTIKSGASGATAIFRGLQTVVAAWATMVAGSFAALLTAVQGVTWAMNKVGIVSDETYNGIRAKASAARDTVVDLGKQTADYGKKAWEAGKGVVTAFEPAEKQLKKTEEQAKKSGDALLGLKDDAEDAADGVDAAAQEAEKLARAYKDLGITTQQELDDAAQKAESAFRAIQSSGEATKREISEAFEAYAQAIIDAGDEAEIKALESEAATLGISDAFDRLRGSAKAAGDESVKAMSSAADAVSGLSDEVQGAGDGAEQAGEQIGGAGDQAEKLADKTKKAGDEASGAWGKVQELAGVTKEAGDNAEEAGEKYNGSFGAWFGAVLTKARTAVSELSVATRNLFEKKIGGNEIAGEAETAQEALARVETELGGITKRMMDARTASWSLTGSGLSRWAIETARSSLEAQKAFYSQAVAMESLVEKIDSGTMSMDQLNRLSDRAAHKFDLLDDQQLQGLQAAIDQARSKIQSLNRSAESTLNSLQQRLADIQGDTERAQQLQYEAERKRLQAELENAQQAGADNAAADYARALKQLEKINEIEQKNRREAENERERKAADRQRQQEQAERERQQFERQRNEPATSKAQTETVKTVNINIGGRNVRVLEGDEDNLIRALENARSTAL